jgi:hypothetical protein
MESQFSEEQQEAVSKQKLGKGRRELDTFQGLEQD